MGERVRKLFGERPLTVEQRVCLIQRAAGKTVHVAELWAALEQAERELEDMHRVLGELPDELGLDDGA